MPSIQTNYGARWQQALAFRNAPPESTTPGQTGLDANSFYFLLVKSTRDFSAPNPDLGDVSSYAADLYDPATHYSGNDILRVPYAPPGQTDGWDTSEDTALDIAKCFPGTAPVLTATAAMQTPAVRGLLITTKNNLTTAKVLAVIALDNDYQIASGQTITINNVVLELS